MCCNNGGTVETLLSEEAPPAKKLCSGGSTAVFSFDTVGGKKKAIERPQSTGCLSLVFRTSQVFADMVVT